MMVMPAHVAETAPKTAYVAPLQIGGQTYFALAHVHQPSLRKVSLQTVPAPLPPLTLAPSHVCIQPTSPSGQILMVAWQLQQAV